MAKVIDPFQITSDMIDMVYQCEEGDEDLMRYHQEHGTMSMLVLTQYSQKTAKAAVEFIRKETNFDNKVVIEIGAGVGFLAMELARYAKQVFAIEVDPAWSWVFTRSLYAHKPKNLTWIFGTAESVLPYIKGDVAVVVTRSGETHLRNLAKQFAPVVIMPLQDDREDTKPR